MASLDIKEDTVPFEVPGSGKPCQTWYRTIGPLSGSRTPLIVLHGGPGACHEYLLPLEDLYTSHKIPVILYDQLGNGKSTRLPEKAGDQAFWTEELFIAELENLLTHLGIRSFDLYGHSWGGMFASRFAARNPSGLRRLVLASAPASTELLLKGSESMRAELPEDVQETMKRCEAAGDFEAKEYEEACMVSYRINLCRMKPWPQGVEAALAHLQDDPTVYGTMFGPSELVATGSLRDWSVISDLGKIKSKTLLINGRYDSTADIAVQPFFDGIANAKWIKLENSSHMGHFEEQGRYIQILVDFLGGDDLN